MITEKLSNLTDRVVEAAQDPDVKAKLKDVGQFALDAAIGEDGLDLVKTDRRGNRRVKKVKTLRVAARALRNPLGVARKAGRGIAKESRRAATDMGVEAARSGIAGLYGESPTEEQPDLLALSPSPSEPEASDALPSLVGDSFWDTPDRVDDQPEVDQGVPSRGQRVARVLSRLRPGRNNAEQPSPATDSPVDSEYTYMGITNPNEPGAADALPSLVDPGLWGSIEQKVNQDQLPPLVPAEDPGKQLF